MVDAWFATVAVMTFAGAFLALLLVNAWMVVSVLKIRRDVRDTALPSRYRVPEKLATVRQLHPVPPPAEDEPPTMFVNSGPGGLAFQDAEPPKKKTDDLGGAGISDAAEQLWQDVRDTQG